MEELNFRLDVKKIIKILFFMYLAFIVLLKLNILTGTYYSNIQHISEDIKNGFYNINLHFFRTISSCIRSENFKLPIFNFFMFVPFGICGCFKMFNNKFLQILFVPFLIILLEVAQFVFRVGFFDIDMLFLNLVGYLISFALFYFCYSKVANLIGSKSSLTN